MNRINCSRAFREPLQLGQAKKTSPPLLDHDLEGARPPQGRAATAPPVFSAEALQQKSGGECVQVDTRKIALEGLPVQGGNDCTRLRVLGIYSSRTAKNSVRFLGALLHGGRSRLRAARGHGGGCPVLSSQHFNGAASSRTWKLYPVALLGLVADGASMEPRPHGYGNSKW